MRLYNQEVLHQLDDNLHDPDLVQSREKGGDTASLKGEGERVRESFLKLSTEFYWN